MFNYIPKITSTISYKFQDNPNPKDLNVVATKTTIVLGILLAGKTITVSEAATIHEIFCLSQIVFYLRHNLKIPVKTKIHKIVNQNGKITARFAEYYLSLSDIAEILNKEFWQ